MGRKIPAKKHRGVKDPLQQQAKRLQSLKGKINAPPKDPDEQPVPRSLMRLFGLQDTDKTVKKKKHKRINLNDSHQSNTQGGKNPISKMKKLPGESGRSFSLRINSAIKALHGSIDQEDYPVETEMEADDVKGERMEAQRKRRERKQKRAGAAAGAGAEGAAEPVPTRTQRLALKKQAKKQREAEAQQEKREVVYERVGFGEVAHAPPALSFKNRKLAKDAGAPRPGRRDLLLSKLLEKGGGDAGAGTGAGAGAGAGARQRQRALPAAERMRRERARQDAVDAYRKIKAAQTKNRTQ